MESKAQEEGTDLEKTKGSGKEGTSVGVRVPANLEEGGRVSPWECGWEEEARLLTKGKEGDGVKGEPEVSRIMCLEAATAENKWDRGKQGGCQMICVCTHTHEHACVLTHMHGHTYLQMCICTSTCPHVHEHVHICIHVCTYNVHTYTCAHM